MAVNLHYDRCFGPLIRLLQKLFGFPEPIEEETIKGFAVLQKKNILDFNDFHAGVEDNFMELLGTRVALQLISTTSMDPRSGSGKLGKAAFIKKWISTGQNIVSGESKYQVDFKWDFSFGTPGAFLIRNFHHHEFFLKSLTVEIPEQGNVHFVCNSWVYPVSKYKTDRIFFSNKSYLPADTPVALAALRNKELQSLRGNGTGKREEWDRVYDYDVYNDLGDPDKGEDYKRPVLGGSTEFPYPRRGRTGRHPNRSDPATESRLFSLNLDMYVPRDERFGRLKMSDFLAYGLKSLVQFLVPELHALFDSTPNDFDSFEDVKKLYTDGIPLPLKSTQEPANNFCRLELIKEFFRADAESLLKYPYPQVIAADEFAWRKDEEFARQMLSGVNPVHIRRLQSFPPRSKLDPGLYGPQESYITAAHIEKNLDGLTVEKALQKKKLFILDHHDTFMPYLNRINALSTKVYASRTILFLCKDDTLKPVAIELSLPSGRRRVFTPAEEGVSAALWQLAKAHVTVNDSGYHELISHWLRTHAVIEPFIIATNRNLSALHPLHKLLTPHFRDTMNINALARHILINAGGILERTVFPLKYSMEMSAIVYKNWRFDEEALPADLLKRGMAVVDESVPHGLRLTIQDYPYAVDGLDIWSAIQSWVRKYVSFFYNDERVRGDTELQAWWHEIRNVGHADKKEETWWYKMDTVAELEKALTIIIWVASALHAATNFGQYAYSGYMPNRPAVGRRFIPEEGSREFSELAKNPDLVFLKTVSSQFQTTLGIGLIEILSRHPTDEVYLGQRETEDWTDDKRVMEAFESFSSELQEIEDKIMKRNADGRLKNRLGPVKVPYTLLYPSTSDFSRQGGITGRGIPNSISI
ncbi:hypothetical protein SUGI_0405860 [Cryptomeria japonica]|uniref:probable linoleate 9S-lipoxygenase 5 n=1 Tax=Cryptomeria japonica TaxID=3369 RepID=UPI002408BC59|nr:probable linoleate 9S-lipoxygenase 5 [Cryptomeria japonica]GLJ21755.1 hypothetical protein SUGI_0405860 [Cryptomeria japonica]